MMKLINPNALHITMLSTERDLDSSANLFHGSAIDKFFDYSFRASVRQSS